VADLNYQNPNAANVTAQLDSRTVGADPAGTGNERRRELVESPSELELLQQILLELRAIKFGIMILATNANTEDVSFNLDNFQDIFTR
jgi:hypothetical protein